MHVVTAFEGVCQKAVWEGIRRGEFEPYSEVGRWWYGEDEIDIVGLAPNDDRILFAECKWISEATDETMIADVYETTVQARAVDPEFRVTVLSRYDRTCPVSGVDHPDLLDVAHVLSWSDYPEHRADLANVLSLSKTHDVAFDCKRISYEISDCFG